MYDWSSNVWILFGLEMLLKYMNMSIQKSVIPKESKKDQYVLEFNLQLYIYHV